MLSKLHRITGIVLYIVAAALQPLSIQTALADTSRPAIASMPPRINEPGFECFRSPLSSTQSQGWEFFTGDYLVFSPET